MTYTQAANLAVNQTLVRSINTTVVALLPIAAILVVGFTLLGPGTLLDLSAWPCSSASRSAPTRRSSSPRRCWSTCVATSRPSWSSTSGLRRQARRQGAPASRAAPGGRRRRPAPAGRGRTPTPRAPAAPTARGRRGTAAPGAQVRPGRPAQPAQARPEVEALRPSRRAGQPRPIEPLDPRRRVTDIARARREPAARHPRLPRARGRLQGLHPAARATARPSARSSRHRRPVRAGSVDVVVGIEARGFILGAAVAYELGIGFVPGAQGGQAAGGDAARSPTPSSTARPRSRCTPTPSRRGSGCSSSTTSWRPVAPPRRPATCSSSGRAPRWSRSRSSLELAFLDGPLASATGRTSSTPILTWSEPRLTRLRHLDSLMSEDVRRTTDAASTPSRVRARFARFGGHPRRPATPSSSRSCQRSRQNHPKADLVGHRAGLRRRRAGPPGPDAQERRRLHHPPARRDDDPRRARHDPGHAGRRAAARHGRGHGLQPRPAAPRLRRRDRDARRRRHQARQGDLRRGRAGRDGAQDGRRDGPRHPRPRHQARRPAAQRPHLALRLARSRPSARPTRPSRSTRRWPTGSA